MIYIGKSVCLRDRVRSYFTGTPPTRKLRRLRREIRAVEWQETGSELEALLLESRLVKRHQPRFNTMLRGFRAATYIRLDWSDPFPRLEVTRQPRVDGADYFGPFRSQDALEAAVSTVSDSLRLRTCQLPGHRLTGTRPCYRMEFGYCAAPCASRVTVTEYRETVVEAVGIFGGQGESPLRVLEDKMTAAAEHLRFETAARLRDALGAIRGATGRQQALQSAIRRLHLLAACPSVREDSLSLFLFGSGRLLMQKEVARAALGDARRRKRLAREFDRAYRKQRDLPVDTHPGAVSAETLDEIQIVSAWMRRRNREGSHLDLSAGAGSAPIVGLIDAWLAEVAPMPGRTDAPGPSGS